MQQAEQAADAADAHVSVGKMEMISRAAGNNGFELGASNPALYRSELVNGFCHGDGFVTTAAEDQIEVIGKCVAREI